MDVTPAAMDLSSLPAGGGFHFEFKTRQLDANKVQPIIDSVEVEFE